MFWNYFNHFSIKLTKKEIKNVTHIISQFHYNFFYLEEKTYYNCYYEKNDIPSGWSCLQLQYFSNIYTGNSLNDKQKIDLSIKLDSFHHYIATKDIDLNGNINYENGLYIPLDYSLKRAKQNSILICLEGANAGNKIGLINKDVCFVNKLACVSPFIVISKFVYYFFNSITFNSEFRDNMQGIIGGIPLSKFKSLSILIPPLQEQERIVNKIDKLFELVDKIEKDQQELEELKKQAKDKVLELAVTGKLVKQDPNDEPASVLLERIKAEKENLIKEGKIKREKADLEPISDDDKNYYENIPSNWSIAKIQSISDSYIGLTYSPNNICDNGIIVLRSSNIKNGKLDFNDIIRVNSRIPSKLVVNNNDIIICARNGSKHLVGKSAFVSNINEPMTFGAFMAICKSEYSKWIYLFLQTKYYYNQLEKTSGTTTINQLTQKAFNNFALPIAPENEQKRIINKVNSLIQLL